MPYRKWSLARLLRSERGVSAVEFAIIAPFLAGMFLGVIELASMMENDHRITKVAAMMGDLASRFERLDEETLDEIHHAARLMLEPGDISEAQVRITSVIMVDGAPEVHWSVHCNWSAFDPGDAVDLADALLPQDGASVLMSEIRFEYERMLGGDEDTEVNLSEVVYSTPREVNVIPLDLSDPNDQYVCPFEAAPSS